KAMMSLRVRKWRRVSMAKSQRNMVLHQRAAARQRTSIAPVKAVPAAEVAVVVPVPNGARAVRMVQSIGTTAQNHSSAARHATQTLNRCTIYWSLTGGKFPHLSGPASF